MDVTLTIPKIVREWALRAVDRAILLGFPLTVFITLKPDLDGLSPRARLRFMQKLLNRLRAYCRQREKRLGCPFPAVYLATRESDPITHLDEHFHLAVYAPDRAEADHMKGVIQKWLLKKPRKGLDDANGFDAPAAEAEARTRAHVKRVDTRERLRGGKLRSVARYLLKAANPQSWKFDSTILWKRSGAIAGPRVFISRNITNRDVVAATRDAVDAVECARQNLIRAGRDADVPVPAPSAAPTPAPGEVPAAAEAASIFPAVVEPEPIEPAVYSASVSPARVHHEAERRDMDLVEIEIETRPAACEPALALREPAIEAPAMAVAHAEAVHPTADVTPAIPPVFIPDGPIAPATSITAGPIVPGVPAEPGPTSSSSNAVLAVLAGFGRSMARTAVTGVGWVASRLGSRSPPHMPPATASPTRRLRAPLFDPSAFISVGAFFGAPDIRPNPW